MMIVKIQCDIPHYVATASITSSLIPQLAHAGMHSLPSKCRRLFIRVGNTLWCKIMVSEAAMRF
jgi:hypothetical protein